jgi:NAD(P)H-dependent flavin oxidoreductase YrpB (nitropropane dioxygenase family)
VPVAVDRVAPKPVLAAGGISDGRGLAAVMALGASGAWIGTRFLASEEAEIHRRYRDLLLAAKETGTEYGTLFDGGWPDAPHRSLRGKVHVAWEAAGRPRTGARPGEGEIIATGQSGAIMAYASHTPRAEDEGDVEAMSLWAGQGVGLVRRTQPAGEIVREIADEARAVLARLGGGRPF